MDIEIIITVRRELVITYRLRTGHNKLNQHIHRKLRLAPTPTLAVLLWRSGAVSRTSLAGLPLSFKLSGDCRNRQRQKKDCRTGDNTAEQPAQDQR